jgi:hypothetical protein
MVETNHELLLSSACTKIGVIGALSHILYWAAGGIETIKDCRQAGHFS